MTHETPSCGRCAAYRELPAAGPGKGLCCLLPPVPICAGMIQPTAGLAGIRQAGPQPLMLNARPQVLETDCCMQFQPAVRAEAALQSIAEQMANALEPRAEPWSGAREAVD